MQLQVSAQTVRNWLKKQGVKSSYKVKKPRLLAKHKRERLNFARRYQHWTTEDWRRVIFSDETKINGIGSDGMVLNGCAKNVERACKMAQ